MLNSLKESTIIRILLTIIVGVVLFQIVFGLVFQGSAAFAIQSLIIVIIKLIKVVIILAVLTGIMLVLKRFFA